LVWRTTNIFLKGKCTFSATCYEVFRRHKFSSHVFFFFRRYQNYFPVTCFAVLFFPTAPTFSSHVFCSCFFRQHQNFPATCSAVVFFRRHQNFPVTCSARLFFPMAPKFSSHVFCSSFFPTAQFSSHVFCSSFFPTAPKFQPRWGDSS